MDEKTDDTFTRATEASFATRPTEGFLSFDAPDGALRVRPGVLVSVFEGLAIGGVGPWPGAPAHVVVSGHPLSAEAARLVAQALLVAADATDEANGVVRAPVSEGRLGKLADW